VLVITGNDAEVDRLRTFDCRMYAPPLVRCDGKATTHNIIEGNLLGYGGFMNNIIYRKNRTNCVTFDEAQLNTFLTELNPNSLALWGALQRNPAMDAPSMGEILTPPGIFFVFSGDTLLLSVHTLRIPVKCNFDHLGLMHETDPMLYWNIIVDIQ
jgi:hypothetical protein